MTYKEFLIQLIRDPKEPIGFPCMDDTPQDGYGRLNLDYRYPDEIDFDEPEEEIDLENEIDEN